jgi:uncharacterized protein (TIGR03083 family)
LSDSSGGNSMALARTVVSEGLIDELERFEVLIRPLSPAQWNTPSRCNGWTVGDVARHVIGSMSDATSGRLEGLGSPEVTQREVDERAGRSAAESADECVEARKAATAMVPLFDDAAWAAAGPGGFDGTLGDGVEALWYDTWLHAQDIRAALGVPPEMSSLHAAVSHVGWDLGRHDWHGEIPKGDDAAYGFILVATGRADGSSLGADAPPNIYA